MLHRIQHETKLTYSAPVSETVFEVRMAPPSDDDQTAMTYRLRTTPQAPLTSYCDGFRNRVDLFNINASYRELTIQATSFVRAHRRSGRERLSRAPWPIDRPVSLEALDFLHPSPLVDRGALLDDLVASLKGTARSFEALVERVMGAVRYRLRYEKRVTTTRTPVSEALALGRGVCQDYAHLFIGASRGLGVPARYVSGYVHQPGELATHAWGQIWGGEGVGWIDVDPTRGGCCVGDDYIVTAVGRDYSDVPPNRGVWTGDAEETMSVSVTVEPVDRVPLEWNDWAAPSPTFFVSQSLSQRQGAGNGQNQGLGAFPRRAARPAYPNQRVNGRGVRRQQGQQQQQ